MKFHIRTWLFAIEC